MKKVFLVIEDFSEMSKMQTYLKKIGFDVIAQGADTRLTDQLVSFFPDVVISYGENKKFSSLSVGQKIKDYGRYNGKVVLILPHGFRPNPTDLAKVKMDALLEAPVHPIRLIQVICKFANMDPNPLVEKYNKAVLAETGGDEAHGVHGKVDRAHGGHMVSGDGSAAASSAIGAPTPSFAATIPTVSFDMKKEAQNDKARVEKYNKLMAGIQFDKKQSSHDRKALKDRWSQLKKDWDFKLLEEIDALKRQFTTALFKKK